MPLEPPTATPGRPIIAADQRTTAVRGIELIKTRSLFAIPLLLVACASLSPLAERASQASLDCLEHQSEFHCNKAIKAAENLVAVSEDGSSCATDATWLQSMLLAFLQESEKIENRKSVLDAISSLKKYCFGVR